MWKFSTFVKFALLSLILVNVIWAQTAHSQSVIEAKSTDETDDGLQIIHIEELSINVVESGGLYQVTVNATLLNKDEVAKEAEFLLPMPKGAVINDYALDIEGQLVSGVLTEKERARKVYTDKVTENIDPGIAERISDNRYRTRIFPVEPDETRKIRLGFSVDGLAGFDWHISTNQKVSMMAFSGNAVRSALENDASYIWSGNRFVAENIHMEANLSNNEPLKPDGDHFIEHSTGRYLLTSLPEEIANSLASNETREIKSLTVIWDTSLSRISDNHAAESQIIDQFIRQMDLTKIRVIHGSDKVQDSTHLSPDEFKTYISNFRYDGGSDLNALLNGAGRSDMCIFVSDGQTTLGRGEMAKPDCPVYTMSGSNDPNLAYLRTVAETTGGHYVPVSQGVKTAVDVLKLNPEFMVSTSNSNKAHWVGTGSQKSLIIPFHKSERTTRITLENYSGQKFSFKKKTSGLTSVKNDAIPSLWAVKEVERRRALAYSAKEIIDFSRPYSLAGAESTLIVLEDPDDYVQAEIPPPANYPPDLLEEYDEYLEEYQEEYEEEYADIKDDLIDIWEDQIEWWKDSYEFAEDGETDTDLNTVVARTAQPAMIEPSPPAPAVETLSDGYTSNSPAPVPAAETNDFLLDEVVATGTPSGPRVTIEIRDWSPERPYLKALITADASDLEDTYQEQKDIYGKLPAFYLEVADFYDRSNQQMRASEILLGAIELPAANVDTYTQVAHRLLSYEQYDRAIELYRHVLELSPNIPQASLNLATALHERALNAQKKQANRDLNEAAELLAFVILTPWDFKYDNDYEGIEIVALMEINSILPKLSGKARQTLDFPKQLIFEMDLDQRVVMDWNIDHADMDLRIDEPTGEEASYSNDLTQIGGQLSNDMTDGYGPEQYLLRNAYKGQYKIKTDYYSGSEYDPNGAVSIRVRITKDFGRKNQDTQTIILEMTDDDDDQIVGTFDVK